MKFSIPKDAFLAELQILQGIVEKRNTMPILANILMNVSASDIELTGTDLEVGLRTHLAAEIEKPGRSRSTARRSSRSSSPCPRARPVQVELKDETIDDPGRGKRVQGPLPGQGGLSPGPGRPVREGHRDPPPGPQGHDRPGLLRHHPGTALLPQRRPPVAEEPADRAHQHGRAPAVVHAESPGRAEGRQGPQRHRGQEDAQRDPQVRGRDDRLRPRREQPLLQGRPADAHLEDHREQVPQLPGGHPQGQPGPPGRLAGGAGRGHPAGLAPLGRAVQGHQVHHREEPHAAVLLQPGDRRGPGPAGRRLQGPGHGDRLQRPVPPRLPDGHRDGEGRLRGQGREQRGPHQARGRGRPDPPLRPHANEDLKKGSSPDSGKSLSRALARGYPLAPRPPGRRGANPGERTRQGRDGEPGSRSCEISGECSFLRYLPAPSLRVAPGRR
ncbi:MAG: hypothetical protein MZU95_13055 [Desulfomicrobium escambiense]|nr:hypothetical protein [Desulfomicrobium escambiense]